MNLVFIETELFSKLLPKYMSDEEFSAFQQFLGKNPNFDDVIPGAHGLRKVRWKGKGKGKRGGLRIIHFNRLENGEIWLLNIFAKNEDENISKEQLNTLRNEIIDD
jgi:mRNA-degrading endonuclease RelE of RelBE toxin-antitoxin system